jgi:transcription initiation factor TFIID subunit 9B
LHATELTQYLASLAHKLNILPLPILPESFEVVRLPPPHQRLAEVNFDIAPGAEVLTESEDSEDDDEEPEPGPELEEDDADGSDEDMEEVDVTEPVSIAAAPVVREMDEDYDD